MMRPGCRPGSAVGPVLRHVKSPGPLDMRFVSCMLMIGAVAVCLLLDGQDPRGGVASADCPAGAPADAASSDERAGRDSVPVIRADHSGCPLVLFSKVETSPVGEGCGNHADSLATAAAAGHDGRSCRSAVRGMTAAPGMHQSPHLRI